jgi:hypothetical protein
VSEKNQLTFETAGNTRPLMTVSTQIHRCGRITDGVSIREHNEGEWRGGFVLAFTDLERWYLEAKAFREAYIAAGSGVNGRGDS